VATPACRPVCRDYARGHVVARHRHDAGQVLFAREGVIRIRSAGHEWVAPGTRAVWMPAGVAHALHCPTAVALRSLLVAPAAAPGAIGPCPVDVSPLLREIILRLAEGPVRAAQRGPLVALLADELRAACGPGLPQPRDPRLQRLTRVLRAEPGATRTLADWTPALGLSRRTLARRFRAETGMTLREWRRRLRLLAAAERLAAGRPVTSVALELGYASPSAFTHAFRRAFGVTPGRYRRAAIASASGR